MDRIFNLTFSFLLLVACPSLAEEAASPKGLEQSEQESGRFERVGGTFLVSKIEKIKSGGFRVIFEAKSGKPKFQRLILETSHIHISVSEGQEIRLSAEIISQQGSTADVSQMVVYLPSRVGDTPVWLLSKHAPSSRAPAKLLEMHAPSTDYQVL
jgi:hypothetical protein